MNTHHREHGQRAYAAVFVPFLLCAAGIGMPLSVATNSPDRNDASTHSCLSESSIVIDKNQCDPTNETRCAERCGLHETRYLVDTGRCCAHVGKSASLLAFERDEKWVPRIDEFNRCTGAAVRLEYLAEGEDEMANALLLDVGASDDANSGEGIFDAYIVQAPWIPAVAGGLANLSPYIKDNAEYVNYQDINPASRSAVSFNGTILALPLDTDYIAIGWREDVFAKHGLELRPPRTIEELADLSERLNGLDHNDDGEPDWGFCLTPQVNYFYAHVAPVFQTNLMECDVDGDCYQPGAPHTGQNLFFDTNSFEPLIRVPGFKYALEQYWRLIRSSNCQSQLPAGEKCSRKSAFPTGRCAGVISMPGTMNNLLKEGGAYAPRPRIDDVTGQVMWKPGMDLGPDRYWGRRARFPGSSLVQRWDGERVLVECDESTCPLGEDGVNYAPFFAEGGESYALNGRQSKPSSTNVMWDLFTWLAELPETRLPLSGQYRKSHLNDDHASELEGQGWPKVMVDDLFEVLNAYFKDEKEGGNPAQDLLMLGFSEYMDALDLELHEKLLLADVGDGGLFDFYDPSKSVDPINDKDLFDERYNRFIDAIENRYNTISREKSGGTLAQLQRWRQSLNMPYRTDTELCSNLLANDITAFDKLNCAAAVDLYSLCLTQEDDVEAYQRGACGKDSRGAIIAAIIVSSILGAALVGMLIYFAYKRWERFRRISAAHEQLMEETIAEAVRALQQLEYPLHLIRGSDFVSASKLTRHERLRDTHKLTVVDSLGEVDAFVANGKPIVFFSHQWTSFQAPDPTGHQFATMCAALRKLASDNDWGEELDDVYVWVDYSCIPQSNQSVQSLAIRSLASYASSATAFIIVAPTCNHSDLDIECDVATYQRRMWCRAEQVCHSIRNGTNKMFLATGTGDEALAPVGLDWFREALRVFDGELTCCRLEHKGMIACDRQSLVIPLLGLYGELYRASVEGVKGGDDSVHASVEAFLDEIQKNQDEIFPRVFERVTWRKNKKVKESVLLFGDLIERMRARVTGVPDFESGSEETGTGSTVSTRKGSDFMRHGVIHGSGSGSSGGNPRKGSDFMRHGVIHGAPMPKDVKVETAVGAVNVQQVSDMA